MREQFNNDLKAYYEKLVKLGNVANEAVHKSIQAYNNQDKELAREIINNDQNINEIVLEIEAEAYRLIALQQPVADDLRRVFTVLLASTDIERIADHATSIAKAVIRFSDEEIDVPLFNEILNKMAEIVETMLNDILKAFVSTDAVLVSEIARRDDEVDVLLKKLYHEVASRMKKNNEVVNYGIGHINIGKSIERIGDYATNICERLVYLQTGNFVELNI